MALEIELGGVHDHEVRRAFEMISLAWPRAMITVTTTVARPSAARVGRGAQIYDTTISKPLWSDGTVWRDAAGTAA